MAHDVVVHYSTSGSAKLGTDYTLSGTPGEVTITAGSSSALVTLHANATGANPKKKKGSKNESKTATLKLQNESDYTVVKPKKAGVNITR